MTFDKFDIAKNFQQRFTTEKILDILLVLYLGGALCLNQA